MEISNIVKKEYKIGPFDTKRLRPEEQGVDIKNVQYKWGFTDNRLGNPLNVILTENIDFLKGETYINAQISYDSSKINEEQLNTYVTSQLEQISKDGRSF